MKTGKEKAQTLTNLPLLLIRPVGSVFKMLTECVARNLVAAKSGIGFTQDLLNRLFSSFAGRRFHQSCH